MTHDIERQSDVAKDGPPSGTSSPAEATPVSGGESHTKEPQSAAHEKATRGPTLTDQTNFLPKKKIITVFLACSTVTLTALWDQTSLAASLYTVAHDLNAGSDSSWIAGSYFLTSTSFQLVYGHLSDIFARKNALISCLVIFFFGSLAASLARTSVELIVFRAITGIGGGGLMTLAQTIVSDVVALRDRGKYQGILGAVVAIANSVGPVVGALLSSINNDSWRWIFRINLFLTAFAVPIIIFLTPLKKVTGAWQVKVKAIDYIGILLTLASSTLVVLALEWAGGEYSWGSASVIAPLVLGIVVGAVFIVWEWKGAWHPVMPLRIFRSALVNGAAITSFINGWLFVVQIYYIPAFFQLAQGYTAIQAGALLLPITLTQTVCSTLSGLIIHWTGRYRESIIAGWILWTVGLGLYSTFDAGSATVGKAIGYGILTGAGVGQTLQPLLIAIQAGVERKDMAAITCTRNFIRNLGSTLGLAVAGTMINSSLRSRLSDLNIGSIDIRLLISNPSSVIDGLSGSDKARVSAAVTDAYSQGFHQIFWLGAGLAGFACIISLLLIPHKDLEGGSKKDEEKQVPKTPTP